MSKIQSVIHSEERESGEEKQQMGEWHRPPQSLERAPHSCLPSRPLLCRGAEGQWAVAGRGNCETTQFDLMILVIIYEEKGK